MALIETLARVIAGLVFRDRVAPAAAPAEPDHVAPNRTAFLTMIAACEGTNHPDGYRALFGWHPVRNPRRLFTDFADHPRVRTYETHDEFIRNGKVDYTTGAGRYQETETTYDQLMRKAIWISGPKPGPGFGPAQQDAHAIELIAEKHALADVDAGRLEAACAKLGGVWASLPTATVGQPKRDPEFAQLAFTNAGGTLWTSSQA